jgi:hypothetical protein
MKGLPARTGLEWLKQGFALFRRQPGVLTMLVFANLMVTLLLSRLQVPGAILTFAFLPCFSIAIQQACRLIDEGERVMPNVLLTGFRRDTIWPLCKLGLVYLGAFVALLLAVTPWINAEAIQQAAKMMQANQPPVFDTGTELAVLAFFFMFALVTLALSFAPALTTWKRMPTFKAIFYSVFAVLGSKRALLVMLLSWLGIYWLLLSSVALLLGGTKIVIVIVIWLGLISALILQCAIYAAYKQIIGAPEDLPPSA